MRRQLCWAVTAAASMAIAVAGLAYAAEPPIVVRAGNMVLRLNGGVTPKALPKTEFVPMGFHASGDFSTVDGTHPPALGEAVFDSDQDIVVSVEGLPACRIDQLTARDTKHAEAACGEAILGKGSATVEVAFPEQAPFDATGPLILFNGGERGGTITFLAYTYVSVPAPTAVVTTAKLTRQRNGVYGLHSVVKIPRIAGGAGSIVRANLSARRVYAYKGERRSVLSGRCPDGRIYARGTFEFRDGASIFGNLVRTCTVAGGTRPLLDAPLPSGGEAGSASREEYVAAVEPICKTNAEASAKILEGVRGKVKAGKLDAAAAQFSRASEALKKTLAQLRAVPQPQADRARLAKWLGDLKSGAELFQQAGAKLAAGDKTGAQAMMLRLNHNGNLANNRVLDFEFTYCRFESSKFG